MSRFLIDLEALAKGDVLSDATREELCVLLAAIAIGDHSADVSKISEIAHTSRARTVSALALWQESGILTAVDGNEGSESVDQAKTDATGEHIDLSALCEESSEKVAADIRDRGLRSLIEECARIIEVPMLSSAETKKIVALYTQYSLTDEYIITLAAYLKEKGKLSVTRLATDAERLVRMGVDNLEDLEAYLINERSLTEAHWSLKRKLGIRNRPLNTSERDMATRWYTEFGFSDDIVGLAFDITVDNTKDYNLAYMDKLLTDWHDNGCATLEDCKKRSEEISARLKSEYASSVSATPKKKKTKEAPRYGEFDVNDAFARALDRSYGNDEEN